MINEMPWLKYDWVYFWHKDTLKTHPNSSNNWLPNLWSLRAPAAVVDPSVQTYRYQPVRVLAFVNTDIILRGDTDSCSLFNVINGKYLRKTDIYKHSIPTSLLMNLVHDVIILVFCCCVVLTTGAHPVPTEQKSYRFCVGTGSWQDSLIDLSFSTFRSPIVEKLSSKSYHQKATYSMTIKSFERP